MVSNRGPVEHYFDDSGRIRRRDAAGGVATALGSVARQQPVTWIATAATDADKAVGILDQRIQIGRDSALRLLNLPEKAFHAHYGVFCNPILWFVQHAIGDQLQTARPRSRGARCLARGLPADQRSVRCRRHRGARWRWLRHAGHASRLPPLHGAAHDPGRPPACRSAALHSHPVAGPCRLGPACPIRLSAGSAPACLPMTASSSRPKRPWRHSLLPAAPTCADAKVLERQGEIEYLGQSTFVWSNPVSLDCSGARVAAGAA